MMSGARKAERTRGKSDPIDATAVARAAIRQPDLPRAFLAGPEREIALLVGHRAHLVHERTRLSKRLRWLLHDLDPQLEPADRMLSQLATIKRVDRRLARREPGIAVRICREHLARLRDLTRRIDALKRELTPMVGRHAPQLLLMPGCGTIVAAASSPRSPTSTAFRPTPSSRSTPASPRSTRPRANKSATASTAPATASSTTPSTSSPSPKPASTPPRATISPAAKPTANPTRKRCAPSNASSSAASSPSCAPPPPHTPSPSTPPPSHPA
jgi:hypothetical protein